MSKTLTEKWREGTLPEDTYYWKVCKENWIADKYEMYDYTKVCDVNKIECLEPVPSYDEYQDIIQQNVNQESAIETYIERIKELEKKLEIATKALKKLTRDCNKWGIARETLKEMEGVK